MTQRYVGFNILLLLGRVEQIAFTAKATQSMRGKCSSDIFGRSTVSIVMVLV